MNFGETEKETILSLSDHQVEKFAEIFFIDRKIGRLERDLLLSRQLAQKCFGFRKFEEAASRLLIKNTTRVIILRHISQTEVYE